MKAISIQYVGESDRTPLPVVYGRTAGDADALAQSLAKADPIFQGAFKLALEPKFFDAVLDAAQNAAKAKTTGPKVLKLQFSGGLDVVVLDVPAALQFLQPASEKLKGGSPNVAGSLNTFLSLVGGAAARN